MGQKVNPIGLRIGYFQKWKSNWFVDYKNYNKFLHLNLEVDKYLKGVFKNSCTKTIIVNSTIFRNSLNTLTIFILFYRFRRKRKRSRYKRFNVKVFSAEEFNNSLPTTESFWKSYTNAKFFNLLKIIDIEAQSKLVKPHYKKTKLEYILNKRLIKKSQFRIQKSLIFDNNKSKKYFKRGKYVSLKQLRYSLETLTNSKINLTLINALSFIKFYVKANKFNNYNFIGIERLMVSRYRYDVKLARDAVYVTFISFILKQPEFLVQFIAYQLKRIPKNRNQMRVLTFYRNLFTILMRICDDIIGCRLKLKGRMNGRGRAKSFVFTRGTLPLQKLSTAVGYAHASGVTVYGTIGVKFWMCYRDSIFIPRLQKTLFRYYLRSFLKENNLSKNVTTSKKKFQKRSKR